VGDVRYRILKESSEQFSKKFVMFGKCLDAHHACVNPIFVGATTDACGINLKWWHICV